MKCSVCPDATLLMSDRQGVEIDYCPDCGGVWLDRGELDKLIQLSSKQVAEISRRPDPRTTRRPDFDDSDFGKQRHGTYRRKSWLSDIFD